MPPKRANNSPKKSPPKKTSAGLRMLKTLLTLLAAYPTHLVPAEQGENPTEHLRRISKVITEKLKDHMGPTPAAVPCPLGNSKHVIIGPLMSNVANNIYDPTHLGDWYQLCYGHQDTCHVWITEKSLPLQTLIQPEYTTLARLLAERFLCDSQILHRGENAMPVVTTAPRKSQVAYIESHPELHKFIRPTPGSNMDGSWWDDPDPVVVTPSVHTKASISNSTSPSKSASSNTKSTSSKKSSSTGPSSLDNGPKPFDSSDDDDVLLRVLRETKTRSRARSVDTISELTAHPNKRHKIANPVKSEIIEISDSGDNKVASKTVGFKGKARELASFLLDPIDKEGASLPLRRVHVFIWMCRAGATALTPDSIWLSVREDDGLYLYDHKSEFQYFDVSLQDDIISFLDTVTPNTAEWRKISPAVEGINCAKKIHLHIKIGEGRVAANQLAKHGLSKA